jgi:hypothetical protein
VQLWCLLGPVHVGIWVKCSITELLLATADVTPCCYSFANPTARLSVLPTPDPAIGAMLSHAGGLE